MCIQKYINTCTTPCNSVIVDIYVRQRRSLPARPSAWESCATAPEHDMASCLPASARNITFEAHRSCHIAEIQQIGGGRQRVELFVGPSTTLLTALLNFVQCRTMKAVLEWSTLSLSTKRCHYLQRHQSKAVSCSAKSRSSSASLSTCSGSDYSWRYCVVRVIAKVGSFSLHSPRRFKVLTMGT